MRFLALDNLPTVGTRQAPPREKEAISPIPNTVRAQGAQSPKEQTDKHSVPF